MSTQLDVMPNSHGTFNILSIDGGPAAPVQVRMLRRIEERFPGFLASTDMFAGTSDGAMVGMFLASRLPKDYEAAKRISLDLLDDAIEFSNATIRALQPTAGAMARFVMGTRPLIDSTRLERVLDDAFGDMKIAHIERSVVVTSLDCDTWQPANFIKIRNDYSLNCSGTICEAILASAALPMYTPVYRAADGHRHLDGVFVANNPSLFAATTVLPLLMRPEQYMLPNAPLSQTDALQTLRILSLGLGEDHAATMRAIDSVPTLLQQLLNLPPHKPTHAPLQWGWFDWVVNRPTVLPGMLHHAQNAVTDWECTALFDTTNYFRYAPVGPTVSVVWDVAQRHAEKVLHNADALAAEQWAKRDLPLDLDGVPQCPLMLEWLRKQWLVEDIPIVSPKPFSFSSSQPPAPADSQPPPPMPPVPPLPPPPKVRRSRSA